MFLRNREAIFFLASIIACPNFHWTRAISFTPSIILMIFRHCQGNLHSSISVSHILFCKILINNPGDCFALIMLGLAMTGWADAIRPYFYDIEKQKPHPSSGTGKFSRGTTRFGRKMSPLSRQQLARLAPLLTARFRPGLLVHSPGQLKRELRSTYSRQGFQSMPWPPWWFLWSYFPPSSLMDIR
jgi:hypothetical protein